MAARALVIAAFGVGALVGVVGVAAAESAPPPGSDKPNGWCFDGWHCG